MTVPACFVTWGSLSWIPAAAETAAAPGQPFAELAAALCVAVPAVPAVAPAAAGAACE
jgi:hypothetical protein